MFVIVIVLLLSLGAHVTKDLLTNLHDTKEFSVCNKQKQARSTKHAGYGDPRVLILQQLNNNY